ncbi:TonB-dependent receptor plug domain-containing protein [Undibacterium sp. Ji42W]|uniref:TonB-dependent receptor plug domain-containing protein n=1 Tax=Undibacterium sp. Ji42W TaxID=3413039 RepID=UPI003BEFF2FB
MTSLSSALPQVRPCLLRRAPAVATVITAADIEATGATNLDGILETIPGLHLERSTVLNMATYAVRGVCSALSKPEVLVLMNGARFGISLGSFNSCDTLVLHGDERGRINVAVSVQHSRTAGLRALVELDASRGFDQCEC